MAIPALIRIGQAVGPASGGDLVRLEGIEIGDRPQVLLGGRLAEIVSIHRTGSLTVMEIRTPQHQAGTVDVELVNLDRSGQPIPGQRAILPLAYRFERPAIAREADLTRLIRQLLRELKRQVVANVSTSVSVDYDDTADGQSIIAMAKLPSLVLTGPTLRQNRFYSANEPHYDVVYGDPVAEVDTQGLGNPPAARVEDET